MISAEASNGGLARVGAPRNGNWIDLLLTQNHCPSLSIPTLYIKKLYHFILFHSSNHLTLNKRIKRNLMKYSMYRVCNICISEIIQIEEIYTIWFLFEIFSK